MASLDLHEKANFTRLSRLLVDKGTEALRNTFDGIHSPANLPAILSAYKTFLLKLKPRVINDSQWLLLYPPSGNPPDSKTFDVTLLTILFRNICCLPKTGWGVMPVDSNRSMQANILRIRLFRNEVYAHVTSTQVDNATFEFLWKRISQTLVDLNISQIDIDELKTCPLGPREEECVWILQDWKSHEEESLFMLEGISKNVKSMESSILNCFTEIRKENRDVEMNRRKEKDKDLLQKLAKHNFKSKFRSKVKFFLPGTREWLLKKVDKWFIECEHESRILLITAGPGVGKTVFSARICEDFKKNGKLAGCHFCDFSDSNLRNPMIMLESLASQMCDNVEGFKEKLLDQLKRHHEVRNLRDAFRIYLQNPLDELELAQPILVVIDALDESAAGDKNEIVNLISDYFQDLPECIKVLVTSRPMISLTKLNDIEKIFLENNDCDNERDLKRYLEAYLPHLANKKADSLINDLTALDDLVQKCEGSFLYAFHAQSELRKRSDSENMTFEDIINFLPKGLDSLYQAYFQRLEAELKVAVGESLDVLKFLEMIVACKSHLPLSFVYRALGLAPNCRQTESIISKVNETVSCLLYVSDDVVTVFHKSIVDWLLARDYKCHEYTVKVCDGSKSLWLICEQIFKEIMSNVCSGHDLNLSSDVRYALVHGFQHLIACNMKKSFFWLVDVVIIHVLLTIFPEGDADYGIIQSTLSLWQEFLNSTCDISEEIRAKISWHIFEIKFSPNYAPGRRIPLLSDSNFYYLQNVLTHSPKGCFSDREREIAKSILSRVPKFVEYNFHRVEVIPLAVRRIASVSDIVAVGLSNDKTMAAFAQSNGIVVVVLAKDLVQLCEFPTDCESFSCCTFAPDDSFILFGKLGTVLNLAEQKEVPFFPRNKETFISCDFSPNGKRLITCNDSSIIKLWDIVTKSLLFSVRGDLFINSCYYSRTGLFIIGEQLKARATAFGDWLSETSCLEKWETSRDVSLVDSWCSIIATNYGSRTDSSPLFVSRENPMSSRCISEDPLSLQKDPVSSHIASEDPLSSPVVLNDPVLSHIASEDPLSSPVVSKDPVLLPIESKDTFSSPVVLTDRVSFPHGSKNPVSSSSRGKKYFSSAVSSKEPALLSKGSKNPVSSPSKWRKFFSRSVSSKEPVLLFKGSKNSVSSPRKWKKFFSRPVSSKEPVLSSKGLENPVSSPSKWKKFFSRRVSSKEPALSSHGSKNTVSSRSRWKKLFSRSFSSKEPVLLSKDSKNPASSPSKWKKLFSRPVSSKETVLLSKGSKNPVSSHGKWKKFFSGPVSPQEPVLLAYRSLNPISSPIISENPLLSPLVLKDHVSSPIISEEPSSSSLLSTDSVPLPIHSESTVSSFKISTYHDDHLSLPSSGSAALPSRLCSLNLSAHHGFINVDDSLHTSFDDSKKTFAKNSFCIWNAITLERIDVRTSPEPNVDTLDSKHCKRCFHPRFEKQSCFRSLPIETNRLSKSLNIPFNSWCRGSYRSMPCVFVLGEKSLSVIENTHFTTHIVWNIIFDAPNSNLHSRPASFRKIAVIKENMFLYANVEKLVVFRTLAPAPEQHLPHSTRVLWTSFSPNGCRLASCTSDGYINIWNVEGKKTEQRFKSRLPDSPFACWWSTEFLFVLFGCSEQPSTLSKYPVDPNSEILFPQSQRVLLGRMVEEVIYSSTVIDFMEGSLVLKCKETNSVRLVQIDRVGGPQLISLPEIQPEIVAVSPDASFVFVGSTFDYCIWKKKIEEEGEYEVFFGSKTSTNYLTRHECYFSSDVNVAVVMCDEKPSRVKFEIIDLKTGNYNIVPFDCSIRTSKLFCLSDERIVIAASRQFLQFFDMETGALLESSYQRYLTKDFVMQTRLSPNDATLAFPNINGGMEFLRLCIPPSTILSNIKEKAAVEWEDARKEFNL